MNHRTNSVLFLPCPVCGKKPYVKYYPPHSGWATCSGTLLHPHDVINAYVKWENPSKLIQALADNWNQGRFLDFTQEVTEDES